MKKAIIFPLTWLRSLCIIDLRVMLSLLLFCSTNLALDIETGMTPWPKQKKTITTKNSSQSHASKAFMTSAVDGHVSYLLGRTVWGDSWQWALFFSKDHLTMHGTSSNQVSLNQFELVFLDNGLVQIKCKLGIESYLAHRPVKKNSWQWAFFASQEFLDKNPSYIKHFRLIYNQNGLYSIQSLNSTPCFLAIKDKAKSYVFFASEAYLDSSDTVYSTSFMINTDDLELKD